MSDIVITTANASETQDAGMAMARDVVLPSIQKKISHKAAGALIVGLRGDLGGGKTTFVQGMAKGLGIKKKLTSPTFVIIKTYRGCALSETGGSNPGEARCWLCHMDCYRIGSSKDILELGFEDMAKDPLNIIVIEWAERVQDILPVGTLWMDFEYGKKKDTRKIILRAL